MEYEVITAVGIDVSKGKSMVAIRRSGGEVVKMPFQLFGGLTTICRFAGGDEPIKLWLGERHEP